MKNSLVPINQSKLCSDYLDMRKPYNGLEEKQTRLNFNLMRNKGYFSYKLWKLIFNNANNLPTRKFVIQDNFTATIENYILS